MSAASVALYNRWRDLMRSWGHAVLEVGGCDTRSASSGFYDPSGLFVEHHDASSTLSGNWGVLATITNGRGGANPVPGPLANLQFARDGQVAIVAKNPANHAGVGGPLRGVPANLANLHSCGAEVANNGLGELYDPRLTTAIVDGEAAWAIVTGRTADYVAGHKEWAPGRKSDPRQDMNARRAAVAARIQRHLNGGFLMALSDAEQADLYDRVKKIDDRTQKIGTWIDWWIVSDDDPATPQDESQPNSKGELAKRIRADEARAGMLLAAVRTTGAGAAAPVVAGGLSAADLEAFVKALADEQDRRARDGDPATGPVS